MDSLLPQGHEVWILDNLCIAKLEGIQLGIDLGELTKPRAVALAGKLEEMCYNRARCIMVVAGDIRRRLK